MREKRCLDDKPEGIEVLKSVGQPTSPNTAYTARFVRPNFGFAETSYMLGMIAKMTLGVRFAPPMLRITPYRLRFPP
jgi:hypothetical protein